MTRTVYFAADKFLLAASASIGNGLEQKMWGINFGHFNVGTNLDDVIGSRARNKAIRLCAKIQDRNGNLTELFRNVDSGHGTCASFQGFSGDRPAGNVHSDAVIIGGSAWGVRTNVVHKTRPRSPRGLEAAIEIAMGPEKDSATMRYG